MRGRGFVDHRGARGRAVHTAHAEQKPPLGAGLGRGCGLRRYAYGHHRVLLLLDAAGADRGVQRHTAGHRRHLRGDRRRLYLLPEPRAADPQEPRGTI